MLIRGSLVRAQLREPENEGVARNRDSFFVLLAYKLHTYFGIESPATSRAKVKFILATDGKEFQAGDVNSGETVACEYPAFHDHFGLVGVLGT
ncbi:MAG TPA: type IIL restriction-modification enzyme MmeI [Sphingobacterium sp.]|nr:type IIL restriction-modification enzyme MmeI [Sphingobacterium sp.]